MKQLLWRNLDGSIGGMGGATAEAPPTLADLTQWVTEAKGDPDAQRASIAKYGDLLFARLAAYDALAQEVKRRQDYHNGVSDDDDFREDWEVLPELAKLAPEVTP